MLSFWILAGCAGSDGTDDSSGTSPGDDTAHVALQVNFAGARLSADGDVILVCGDSEVGCSGDIDPPGAAELEVTAPNWMCAPHYETIDAGGTYELTWDGSDGDFSDWVDGECGLAVHGEYCTVIGPYEICEDWTTQVESDHVALVASDGGDSASHGEAGSRFQRYDSSRDIEYRGEIASDLSYLDVIAITDDGKLGYHYDLQ